jgi:hypothetical protein
MEQISKLNSRGQIRDELQWFVSDNTFTRLNVDNFKKYGKLANKSISSMAEDIKVSRPKLYQHEAIISDKFVREKLIPLVMITDLAFEAFGKDHEKTIGWVMQANHLFFGFSPYEMALGGRAESVIQTLKEWLGK